MSFDLNEFAKEVHQNAIDHGFWDDDATDERQIALIHSEWSEALQADRSGCTPREVCMELIDGVLRVLDYCAANKYPVDDKDYGFQEDFFSAVCRLHTLTENLHSYGGRFSHPQSLIISLAFTFCRSYGLDPYDLMQRKHEYNLTRPHKHGKRY